MEVIGTTEAQQRARQLRCAMTKSERLLWWALMGDKTGHHWRRQHAAGPYVLDFYCDRARLCVEVDGESHDNDAARDAARDAYFVCRGIATLRVAASEVTGNLQGVVNFIGETVRTRPLRHRGRDDTSPKGEGL